MEKPVWVPGAKSVPPVWEEGAAPYLTFGPVSTVRHARHAKADAVRGVDLLHEGHWRVEYRLNVAAHGGSGFGIVIGVSDAEAAAWREGADAAAPSKVAAKPSVAWGLCPSSGCLIETADPHKGRFDGATVGLQLIPRQSISMVSKPGGGVTGVAGLTVAIEVDIPPHNSDEQAISSRRNFARALHPLDASRNYPNHLNALQQTSIASFISSPITRPSSLAFSINGGELIRTEVRLPSTGVYPWVLLTGEGDEVTLTSIKKLSPDF